MRAGPIGSAPEIAFAGSSAVEPTSPLPAALAAELGLRSSAWVALGRRGSRLAEWTRPELPEGLRAIVVLLTANDSHPTAASVREIDAALRRIAGVVVWLPPMPYPAGSVAVGRDGRMRRALRGAGVVWVERSITLEPAQWAPDRVHLTVAGYRAYARQVAPDLAARLASGRGTPAPAARAVGHVVTPRGLVLPLTSLDAVWMARACAGEGGGMADASAVTSTMIRRWAMLRDADRGSPFRTLTDLVVGRFAGADPYEGDGREVALRGYSQPVAVQWRGRGVERRRRVRTLGWDGIEPWRRRAVLEIVTGRAPLTAKHAVHFAAHRVVAARLVELPRWRVVEVEGARNVFVSTRSSRALPEPVVVGADELSVSLTPRATALRATPAAPSGVEVARVSASDVPMAAAVAALVLLGVGFALQS